MHLIHFKKLLITFRICSCILLWYVLYNDVYLCCLSLSLSLSLSLCVCVCVCIQIVSAVTYTKPLEKDGGKSGKKSSGKLGTITVRILSVCDCVIVCMEGGGGGGGKQ